MLKPYTSRSVILSVIAVCFSLVCIYQASAQTVVDPQIFIQQSGTSPAGGDPNSVNCTVSCVVGVAGGQFVQQSPLLIIVGVYNGNGTPSISFTPAATTAAAGTYGLTYGSGTTSTLGAGQDAYAQLGLSKGASESFTNWSAADVANGFAAPASFTLYAFALTTELASGSPITIDESGAAAGSFIIGFDCNNGTGTNGTTGGCATNGDVGSTPFTNAGLIGGTGVPIPEPASMLLFGTGLVALGAKLRRRKSGKPVTV